MGSKIDTKIVEHAIKCFAAKGYHGTTTKEIAVAANVTEGSVFRLFHSKEGLFQEAIRSAAAPQLPIEEFEALLKREGDFRQVLFSAVRRWYRMLSPEYARISTYSNLDRGLPRFTRTMTHSRVRALIKGVADAVDRHHGRIPGSRKSLNSAKHFMYGLFYFKLTRSAFKDSSPEMEFLQEAVDVWLSGINSSK